MESITVLMTVFNGGHYLKMAIESVLSQTYKDFEFLIINDCSTDNSVDLIESYKDNRIVIHNNINNIGQTASLNIGLNLAKGKYIARIDADDFVFPDWLETQLKSINEFLDFAVISANAIVIDERNRIRQALCPGSSIQSIILNSNVRSPINHVGSVLNKEKVLKVGGYDPEYRISADFDLWSKLLRNDNRLYVTNKILMAIRIHKESLSKSAGEQEMSEITRIIKKNIDYFFNKGLSEVEVENLSRVYYGKDFSFENLENAIVCIEHLSNEISDRFKINGEMINRWKNKQITTLLIKRMFDDVSRSSYDEIRRLSSLGMSKLGVFSVFFVLFCISYLGRFVISRIPLMHEAFLRFSVKWRLRNNFRVKLFT